MKATLYNAMLGAVLVAASATSPQAAELTIEELEPPRFFAIEEVVTPEPSFIIAAQVDNPQRVYREGETMTVTLKAERECFAYLTYSRGKETVWLFPNQHQQDNRIPAQTLVTIPGDGVPFRFRTMAPFGEGVLHVVALEKPLETILKDDPDASFKSWRQFVAKIKESNRHDWAETHINITTISRATKSPKTGKRVGVCIGISQYQHDSVNDLQGSHLDAKRMSEAMRDKCQVDKVLLLTDEQATRANIEQAIFRDLVDMTRPGDTVFIFFSGHGGRTEDRNGDEKDGFDEYLVPHDAILGKLETMILDDTFARWLQELSGRKVAIIIDTVYSGGIEAELKRSKDLGQRDTVVVAACQADQLAWEMPASQKGSVLTHYLIESLNDKASDTNRDGKLTMQESYTYAKQKVEQYVKQKFDTDQNPIIVNNAQEGIVFQQQR